MLLSSFIKAQMITTYAGNGQNGATVIGGLATNVKFQNLNGIAVDGSGNLYICDADQYKIFKVTPAGIISLFAGNGFPLYGGDGGLAINAAINRPEKIVIDASGNVYFTSVATKTVRKINTSGIITTVAGNGVAGFSGDGGSATAAKLNGPQGLAVDAIGNLYIDDAINNRLRKVTASTGIITTIAGTGVSGQAGDGGLATLAQVNAIGLAVDAVGNIYLSAYNGIRKITASTGIITTIAGTGTNGYSGDGGPALAAQFGSIFDIRLDPAGNLYITDWIANDVIRKIDLTTNIVTTVAGNGTGGFSGDGSMPLFAQLSNPNAIAFNSLGQMFVGDNMNNRIRKVDFLATPICPNSLSLTKTRGVNGSAILSHSITPFIGTPNYTGIITGNSLSNPLVTVNYSTINSYTQTFTGNGIYNITANYRDTISSMICLRTINDTILINNSLTPKQFNRRFTLSNSYFCNTGNVTFTDSSRFNYSLNNTPSTYTIITNWGNGSITTNTVVGTNNILITSASNSYTNPGVYTLQSIIKGVGMANDTVFKFVQVDACGNINGIVYNDADNNCSQTWSEYGIPNLPVSLINATNYYSSWTNSGGYYSFNNIPAGVYTISVNGSAYSYTTNCPSSLPHSATISGTTIVTNDFALNCTGGFDVATTGISLLNGFFPGQTDKILPHVGIINGACDFIIPGKVKMILTPCIQYVAGGSFVNPPNTIIPAPTGDTLVWNVADINNIGNFSYWNYAVAVSTCTNAMVGDSACITMMVLPTSGDINIANNIFTRCFAIGVSYDPNYKEVTPKGIGSQGYIPPSTNKLTYTLHFQNTGTAKATNIYLLDTISNNLNITSIEIISSSHYMQPYILPNRTMKFMFPYINLPDSTSDEEHSHGYVTYKVNLNPSLAPGTKIKNTCFIYFDYNTPIATNTALNTIQIPTSINTINANGYSIYPNPNKGFISIASNEMITKINVVNVLGQTVKTQLADATKITLDITDLTANVYFIEITNSKNEVSVSKIIKE